MAERRRNRREDLRTGNPKHTVKAEHPGENLIILAKVQDNNFVLDNDALYGLMHQDEVEGRPLSIISIAGAFRSGKSFILNFFLRYLYNKGWENPSWFGDRNAAITGGFPWKRGKDACTEGINVWPEVFSVPTRGGRQAAVIIVDTQGLFDDDTSPDINAKLMSLSTLFCSHQILNLMRHIEERDLEHLQLCIAFAKAAAEIQHHGNSKPFQRLTFLVRDWEHEEVYGDSTNVYLKDYFGKKSRSSVVQKVKKSIPAAFDQVGCSLLPHPGKTVAKKSDANLTNKDLDKDFEKFVTEFVESVLHPDNLVFKRTSDGAEETFNGLMNTIATVGNSFVGGKIPTTDTLLQSVAKAHNTTALNRSVTEYKSIMSKSCKSILLEDKLQSNHRIALEKARELFHSLANFGDEEGKVDFLQGVEKECEDGYDQYKRSNEGKKSEKMLEFRKAVSDCLATYEEKLKKIEIKVDVDTFEKLHARYNHDAISRFDTATQGYSEILPEIQGLKGELIELINSRYKDVKQVWESEKRKEIARNRGKCSDLMHEIKKDFEKTVDEHGKQYEPDLERILNDSLDAAVVRYDDNTAYNPEKQVVQKNKELLLGDLKRIAEKAEHLNREKRVMKLSEFQSLVDDYVSNYRVDIEKVELDASDETFERNHSRCQHRAMEMFDSRTKLLRQFFPEIPSIRLKLARQIASVYNGIKEHREYLIFQKQAKAKEESFNCKHKILEEFRAEAAKYEGRYVENLAESLQNFKDTSISKYDHKMVENSEKLTVEKNREALEREINQANTSAIMSNAIVLSEKVEEFRFAMRDCLSTYKSYVKKADLSGLPSEHRRQRKQALDKFDASVDAHKSLPEIISLRNDLRDEISNYFDSIQEQKQNEMDIQKELKKIQSSECMVRIVREFDQEVFKYRRQYQEDLEDLLEDFKNRNLSKYDKEMANNNQKDPEELRRRLDGIITRAEYANMENRNAKVGEFRSVMRERLSEYKSSMRNVELGRLQTAHKNEKRKALEEFDSAVKPLQKLPEVISLRKDLIEQISDAFETITINKRNESERRERQNRDKSDACMHRVAEEFEGIARKYVRRYEANLENILDLAKKNCLEKYNKDMAWNAQSDPQALESRLDKIINTALDTNRRNHSLLKQESEDLGRRMAEAYEAMLDEPMRDSHLKESVFDDYKRKFMSGNVKPNSEYKQLPSWGQDIVESAVNRADRRLRRQNEENAKHRGISLSGVWKGFKGGVRRAWSGFKGLVSKLIGY